MSDSSLVRLPDVTDCVADELRALFSHVDSQLGGTAMLEGVEGLLQVADITGRLLQRAGHWYDVHAEDLFDERRGAEHSAAELARGASAALRDIGRRVCKAAVERTGELDGVRELDRRELHMLDDDERLVEPEYFAITEVDCAAASDTDLGWSSREDVARFKAREAAQDGFPGCRYAVIHVIEGERLPEPLAAWRGERRRATP